MSRRQRARRPDERGHAKVAGNRHCPSSAAAATVATERPRRIDSIDALRGIAICMMIVYHAAFDLNWFHIIAADFNHNPFWLAFRDLIVSSFLLLVGVSLVLARRARVSPRRFWRRIAIVGGCALLVTVGSYAAFPGTFITFGILHCIVVSSILAWPLVPSPRIAAVLGVFLIVLGSTVGVTVFQPPWVEGLALFDVPWLNWVGLMTHRPATEDYVPMLPWFGVVLAGIGIGGWLARRPPAASQRDSRTAPVWLTWLGRHSLLVYMLHQPIMIGILTVLHG